MRKLIKDEWDKDYNCWSGSCMIYFPEEVEIEDKWHGHSYYYSNPDNGLKYTAEAARKYLNGELDRVDSTDGGGSDNWRTVSSVTRTITKKSGMD